MKLTDRLDILADINLLGERLATHFRQKNEEWIWHPDDAKLRRERNPILAKNERFGSQGYFEHRDLPVYISRYGRVALAMQGNEKFIGFIDLESGALERLLADIELLRADEQEMAEKHIVALRMMAKFVPHASIREVA